MKILITESKYKDIIFRYFDKFGGEVDKDFISMFRHTSKEMVNFDLAYRCLIEWRGEEESKQLAKTLLLQNPHHINDFGSYDFFFEVTDISNWDLNDKEPNVVVKVKVNDLSGSLVLIETGEPKNLRDALNNEDYGWEVDDEVKWGVEDYFRLNITTKTGIKIIFSKIDYISKQ
jgi:hypothetical protein